MKARLGGRTCEDVVDVGKVREIGGRSFGGLIPSMSSVRWGALAALDQGPYR